VGLRLTPERQAQVDGLDPDLRLAAESIGVALRPELVRRAPTLVPQTDLGDPPGESVLVALELDREPEPDPLTLAACVAGHRAYVAARGRPDGLSLGALALARILAWASRAALLGAAPRIAWLGPPSRRPEPEAGQVALEARCVCEVGGRRREARASALVGSDDGAEAEGGHAAG
jgi:hypothetical protein